MKKYIILLLCLSFSVYVDAQVFNLGNTVEQSGWYKIGTLTLQQQGADAEINIISAGGYNADYQQNGECHIHFRTSNGSHSTNGFFGSGTFYNTGRTAIVSELTVVQLNSYTWEFYCVLPAYTGSNAIVSLKSSIGTWQGGLISSSPPSNAIVLKLKEELTITSDVYNLGNVGIGTTTPTEKLSVNGKIRAKEVKVEAANWPDYVFEAGYKIPSLSDLEKYIKENGRLPDMPKAKDVEDNGVELGEMNKLLLKKIEELTLILIQKDKQTIEQEKKNMDYEKRLLELERSKKNK